MSENNQVCVIVGASHAGVNCAFALRKEGWQGNIILFDTDSNLPYHRPPLSKTYLTNEDSAAGTKLKSAESYAKEAITLRLGTSIKAINRKEKNILLDDQTIQTYDHLVLATGARPLIPPIDGIDTAVNLFPMRTLEDAIHIRQAIMNSQKKRVVVIGGGYIGLETAASLRKLKANVTVLEREDRLLARVTSTEMSSFFKDLHEANEVNIETTKNVVSIENKEDHNLVSCTDGSQYIADIIVLGVGIRVNTALAEKAGLEIENGIKVDASTRTNDENIYAIGDCSFHHNPHYDCYLRLESVQNAVDQAKVTAATICGKEKIYNSIPWFWSDQYDIKLQMVGLSEGYTEALIRKEAAKENQFSVWYFKEETLLAIDAVNNAKAYILGTKFIKNGQKIDKTKLMDLSLPLKPNNLI